MKVKVLAFGIARNIFGGPAIDVELFNENRTADLKQALESKYPKLKQLISYMVAVNSEYAADELVINEGDEVAVIPPVSGG